MEKRINSSSKSGDSSILREFSPDLGFHDDDLCSPTGSITDIQDEWEKIEGSRFFSQKSWECFFCISLNKIRFGVPWLDAWFSAAEEDEKLGETFLRFSSFSNFFVERAKSLAVRVDK